jgi:hypothetical protein
MKAHGKGGVIDLLGGGGVQYHRRQNMSRGSGGITMEIRRNRSTKDRKNERAEN